MVYVPDEATKTWDGQRIFRQIYVIIRALYLPVVTVEYLVDGNSIKQHHMPTNGIPRGQADSSGPHLNPNYTFLTFVVGASNQMSRAGAHNVATRPSRSYNPLFIHGDTGVGKNAPVTCDRARTRQAVSVNSPDPRLNGTIHKRDDRLHSSGPNAVFPRVLPLRGRAANRRHPTTQE
jgi:hypothetical protein